MMNIQKKYKYKNFVFVLINDFSLIAFSNAIEPLRIANRQAQKEIYTWKLMSENGENVKCSSGFLFKVDSVKHLKKKILYVAKRKNSKIGLMFGPEASGLSNIDLSLSNFILQIPTTKNFKSLNLSHSVTVICYEIFKFKNKKTFNKIGKKNKISSKSDISLLVKHLVKLLEKKNFFLPIEKKHSMVLNINNLIYRLEPNDKELRILASIISSLSKK